MTAKKYRKFLEARDQLTNIFLLSLMICCKSSIFIDAFESLKQPLLTESNASDFYAIE